MFCWLSSNYIDFLFLHILGLFFDVSFLFTPDFLESRDAIVVCSVPCFSQPCFHSIPVFTCTTAACAGGGGGGGGGGAGCGAGGAGGGGGHLHASVEGTTRPSMG